MKKLIILSLLAISFTSCKNKTAKEEQNTPEEKEAVAIEKPSSLLEMGCYAYNDNNNNAVNLEITSLENGVTGKLTYALDGKDSNSGTFNGELKNDKLFGIYTFISEGIESKRDIAFLIKDNQLIEGYGELSESGTAFVDKSNINYTSTMPLTKTDCDK
ncbi:hypothetical protein OOZ15_17105 [Galbibacter sp. EGI 63066]|uniref:hypothetical protein n=1 Tax=Galbibacter sp. EGI 63066 TaxID=2993559 RepID=UPI002248D463|nr:hypothetical protein [Galbibacter sp. EGI 63066]MCX2681674.1 hypothetical protein [Galbibacter sp. EGI 63066]